MNSSFLRLLAVGTLFFGLYVLLSGERASQTIAAPGDASPAASAPVRECHWATGEIKIDGKADEAAWKNAPVISDFVVGWLPGGPKPSKSATRARLLWDDKNLYFFADMDDHDLYADVKEHDGDTWYNDVFELFFKPTKEKRSYYEFEISPANTVFDMFVPSRGSGGVRRWVRHHDFHLKTAVALRGTLNTYEDQDQGWSLEGAIPWADFSRTGGKPNAGDVWDFTLTRYDYSTDYEGPDLSATAPLTRPDFHRYEDYTPLKFVK